MLIMFPQAISSLGLKCPSFLSLSQEERCSNPLVIFLAAIGVGHSMDTVCDKCYQEELPSSFLDCILISFFVALEVNPEHIKYQTEGISSSVQLF